MIFCAAILPIFNGSYSYPYGGDDLMWERELVIFWTFLFFFSFTVGAMAFISYDTKGKRIYSLTFPVSNLEKFLTYILFYVVGVYVIFIIGYFVADSIRVWTAPIYAVDGVTIEHMPLKYFLSFGYDDGSSVTTYYGEEAGYDKIKMFRMMAFTGIIGIQAFFVLCASIWPKHGRLRGILSVIGITVAINFILYLSMKLVFAMYGYNIKFRWADNLNYWIEKSVFNISFSTFLAVAYIISISISAGMYLLSYLRFKEMESIERW
ncbi:MAG: hypothetical protein K2K97_06615, partial [Muribaculaceae bacterium]|nr:hypothetical protein [Muribaculaceae bacterium]